MLGREHRGDVGEVGYALLGVRSEREGVGEVADHACLRVDGDLAGSHGLGHRAAEHRHQQAAVVLLPVDVEPPGEPRGAAEPEHVPQFCVELFGHRDRHVVGHEVDDEPESVRTAGGDELRPPLCPAQLVIETLM